jgi:electron transport complex protein RnfE
MKQSKFKIFSDGIIKNNQALVFLIGMCPTLAMTTSLNQALGMSVAVFAVLLLSNILISATRKFTPDEIRLPIYIIIIATLVSIVGLVLKAYA